MALGPAAVKHALTDKFGLVLLSCILTYMLMITVDSPRWVGIASSVPVIVTVLLAIWASDPGPYLRWSAIGLAVGGLVTGVINAGLKGPDPIGVSLVMAGLALGIAVVAMLARMVEHTRVSVRTVLAVIASYVMLGLFFAYIDSGVGHIAGTFFAQPNAHSQSDYVYLSYVTLTTTGFGDLTAGTGLARSLITLEALTGQIFLVTLVARMVSLYGTSRAPFDLHRTSKALEEPE